MPRISPLMKALSWLYVTRAPFLTATIIPVLVGALVAPWLVAGTDISVGRLLLTLLGARWPTWAPTRPTTTSIGARVSTT